MTAHHVEMFQQDGRADWGWQCFTCDAMAGGYLSLTEAERRADAHVAFALDDEDES